LNKALIEYCAPSKLVSTVVSTFTAYYVHLWPQHFPDLTLTMPLPSFDGRAVIYPGVKEMRDYMSWRQVDCAFFRYFNRITLLIQNRSH